MTRPAVLLRSRGWLAAAALFVGLCTPLTSRGTVQAQRARLPPPAPCTDPVVGVWRSHNYNETVGHWNQFTLSIRRDGEWATPDAGPLVGTIVNHSWDGGPEDEEPGVCEGELRFLVSMDARGTYEAGVVSFHGVGEWRLDELLCGLPTFGYNLDHFRGTIEPELQEFQSLNNDGGLAINVPTVFRRVACGDDGLEPVVLTPPPYFPAPTLPGGCW